MSKPQDGGPAFPRRPYVGRDCEGMVPDDSFSRGTPGMSLRDYFAGQSLAGLLAAPGTGRTEQFARYRDWCQDIADSCYSIADAMLTERQKERK